MPCYSWAAFVAIMLVFTLGSLKGVYAEDDIHGMARLTYRSSETETETEGKESSWLFSQVYNLMLSKALTPKVEFTANVDANVIDSDEEKTTFLSPDLRLYVRNEYFDANTGYELTERGLDILTASPDGERYTTKSWNANLFTKSEKYPTVRLLYNEDRDHDHLDVHRTDNKTTDFFGNAEYAYRFLRFSYDYRNNIFDDYVTGSTQKTDTNYGRADFRKSFWENRVTSSGSYFLTKRRVETTTSGKDRVPETKQAYAGLYAEDPLDPCDVRLESRESLIDGDKITSTGIDIGGGSTNLNQNIGVDLNFATEVEQVKLYTTPPEFGFSENDFTWAVYSSNDNLTWTPITNAAGFDYDTNEDLFEISFTCASARYFKVVNTNNNLKPLYVTEIEAIGFTTAGTTDYTFEGIQAYLGAKPVDWLSFTYNFTQDKQDTDPGSDQTRTTNDVSGRVERELHRYLGTWAQYRRRWVEDSEVEDTTTDTYLLHFLSSPLETLDTDLSFTHTVLKEESETQSKSSSVLFQVVAWLLEGAELDIDATIIHSEDLKVESKTISRLIDANLRLELTPMLTAEIEYDRAWTETKKRDGDATRRPWFGQVILYWRPSHEFYLRASYEIDKHDKGDKTFRQQYNLSWLMTEKIEFNTACTLERNDKTRFIFSPNLSWDLSRMLTLRFLYDWSRYEEDTVTEMQTFMIDLSARF